MAKQKKKRPRRNNRTLHKGQPFSSQEAQEIAADFERLLAVLFHEGLRAKAKGHNLLDMETFCELFGFNDGEWGDLSPETRIAHAHACYMAYEGGYTGRPFEIGISIHYDEPDAQKNSGDCEPSNLNHH